MLGGGVADGAGTVVSWNLGQLIEMMFPLRLLTDYLKITATMSWSL